MNDRLVTVRNLLREAAEAMPTPNSPQGRRIVRAASTAMASILSDPDHPFTRYVQEIEWKPADEAADRRPEAPAPWFYWLFWPMPGGADPQRRRFGKAAFLLFIAGMSQAGREAIAASIPMPTDPPGSLSEADIESVIKRFMPNVLGELSLSLVPRLSEALAFLDRFESAASRLTIVDHHACLNDRRARLSKLQIIYLRELLENFRQPLTHARFRELGVQDPRSMKHKLVQKLAKAGIYVDIVTPRSGKADTLLSVRSTPTQ